MKLFRKLLVALALASIVGVLTYTAVSKYVVHKAEENLHSIMLSHRSFHDYIQKVMHPIYYQARDEGKIAVDFYAPEILSSSFIVRVMHGFFNEERKKEGLPPIYYKLASQNPRNPVNKADEKEAELIKLFNIKRDLQDHFEIATISGQKYLIYAKPFLETNQACIRCHGKRSDAPIGLQKIYSGQGGFNETTGVIRAIESIRVPITDDISAALVATTFSISAALILIGLYLFNLKLRQKVEESTAALADSEENYRQFATLTSDYVHKCSRKGDAPFRIQWIGGALNKISGYSIEEMFERGYWMSIVHPDDQEATTAVLNSLQPGDIREITFRIIARDQTVRWIADKCRCESGTSSEELILYGAATDITEKRYAEDLLKFTRVTVNALSDSIFWITPDGKIVDVNEAACKNLGYSREELLQLDVSDVDTEHSIDDMQQQFSELRKHTTLHFESTHRTKDGSVFPVDIVATFVRFGEEERNCAIARDISDRKRAETERTLLEAQLNQAQKMESIGNLAGGVAHDFNNKLTVILGYTCLAETQHDVKLLHGYIAEISKAAEQSADLTRQLLAFARKQTIAPKVLDLNVTISGMLKMLQRLIGEDICLNWRPAPDLWKVEVDPSQVDQILANLCVNARDSIADIGTIIIETGISVVDEEYCVQNRGFTAGEYVRLAVSDNGCGMEKETLSQIFEPFFTTKEIGKGTGLGLATVYGIVRQNKGFINVYSEPGLGTTFTIYLPRYIGTSKKDQTKDAAEPAKCGKETILLVEDDPAILKMTTMILSNLGYKVLASNFAAEAIAIANEHGNEIDLLMTDVVMPEMNGRDLAKKLQSQHHNIKCLYMSGYTADVIANHGVLEAGLHFIQKPFSMSTLAIKIREVLV